MPKGISVPVTQSGLESSINQAVKNVGPINIPANIDPSAFKNLAQPLGRVSGLATEFEKSIAASNARVLAFGASVGIINGVQNAFSDLVKTGIEVQKTLTDIAAISGQGGRELSKFGDALFDIGKSTGQSFKTAAQAALEFSRQGLGVEETLKRTTDALTLTRFTSLNAAEAVDVLTAAANSFSSTGITTAQIINKLVAVDTKFAVSAEDLANGLSRAGSIAQEVGVSFDELNAAITVAQERTARGGAVIGNALKTIFTRLRSDETVQALRAIGVESLNAQGELKGAIPLLQEVAQKVQGMSGGAKIQILEAVASKYNINILSSLLDDLNNANSKFTQAVSVSAGASTQAYERQIELNKALAAQINAASVSVTQLFNKLSEIGVTDSLTTLLKFVNDLVNGFNKLLDSEGVGGNIAKGLIKGISDVFFTIGLPIIGAIFIKLTKDIAQFGVESLKTILGINQQVRERQALEQAVVNTLIQDQQIMASILALSGNRSKQEEYLLGVYNRQLNALQQVQNIASSVTPALMAGGLSATTGRIQKRGAGGYLPGQEASDVRRGVGGASPSSKVVSIPNFAFGGGRRGTMIANTSEYIVPNFANGGSAIFNKDMARAYGLPSGARKISAAGGYIPNFAGGAYAALVGEKASGEKGILDTQNKWVYEGDDKKINISSGPVKGAKAISFDVYGVPSRSAAEIEKVKENLQESGKILAVNLAQSMTGNTLPSDFIQGKLGATFNPGSLASFAGTVFEASVGALLGDKSFKDYSEQVTTSAFDLNIAGNQKIKDTFGIDKAVQALEIKGSRTPKLMDSVARKIYQITEGQREAFTKRKIGDTEAKQLGISRPVSDLSNLTVTEGSQVTKFGSLSELETYVSKKYTKGFGNTVSGNSPNFGANVWPSRGPRAASGYVPNFAKGNPLKEAIGREISAGVSPSAIRITQDGRLRNAGNPNGLAVINTRDEPNGRIPNFAEGDISEKNGHYFQEIGGKKVPIKASVGSVLKAKQEEAMLNPPQSVVGAQAGAGGDQNSKKIQLTTEKLLGSFVALQIATSALQSTFKDTDSIVAKALNAFGQISTTAAGYGSLGSLLGESLKGRTGMLGKMAGYMGPIGMGAGAAIGVFGAIQESRAAERAGYETQGKSLAQQQLDSIRNLSLNKQEEITNLRAAVTESAARIKDLKKEYLAQMKEVDSFTASEVGGESYAQRKLSEKYSPQIDIESARKLDLQKKLQAEVIAYSEQEAANARRKAELEKEVTSNLQQRLSVQRAIFEFEDSFNIRANKNLIDRAKKQAELIAASRDMNQYQKVEAEFNQKLIEFAQQRADLEDQALRETFIKIKNESALATIDKKAFDDLVKRVKNQEQLGSLEQEYKDLKTDGAILLTQILENLGEQLKRQKDTNQAQEDAFKTTQRQTIETERLIKSDQIRLSIIQDTIAAERKLADIRVQGARSIEDLTSQTGIIGIQNQISRQPFATRSQEASLARLNAELAKQNEIKSISRNFDDAIKSSEREKQDAYSKTASELNMLIDAQQEHLQKLIQTKNFEGAANFIKSLTLMDPGQGASWDKAILAINNADEQHSEQLRIQNKLKQIALTQLKEQQTYELAIINLREKSPMQAGAVRAINEISKEAYNFQEAFAYNTTNAFRDGLRDAMSAAISQTDDLGAALQNVAINFLKTMQNAFLQNAANNAMIGLSSAFPSIFPKIQTKARGGLITGGSGYRDDVPAMLTGGEFVMRKSAVQKYGAANLAKMNNGGIFLPGVRGGGAISGYDALRAFANQTTTSGATDVLRGGGSSAFINLEDQSSRLSRFALLGDDTINQEIRSAQEQGLNIIAQREAYRTQQRKAFQQQLVGTILSAAASYGTAKIGSIGALKATGTTVPYTGTVNDFLKNLNTGRSGSQTAFAAYGGMIRRYASGGPTDDIPALLMSGEYVMNRGATSKYGRRLLDSMNQGRASRFADGGEVGTSATTTTESNAKMMGDVSININVSGQGSQIESQGNTSQGGIDYKKMSERIKAVVLETINEEKRLGGALRTR